MPDPTSIPTSINFVGALLFDDKANFVTVTSGSVLNVTQSYVPIAGMCEDRKVLPLSLVSGSYALKVTQISARPVIGEYSAATTLINGQTVAHNLFSIENPSGSKRLVIVKRVVVSATVAAVAAVNFLYRLGRHNTFRRAVPRSRQRSAYRAIPIRWPSLGRRLLDRLPTTCGRAHRERSLLRSVTCSPCHSLPSTLTMIMVTWCCSQARR